MPKKDITLFDRRIFSARLISKLIVFEGEDLRAVRSLIYGTWCTCTPDEAETFLDVIKSSLAMLDNYNPAVKIDIDDIIKELKNILISLRKEEEALENIKNSLKDIKVSDPLLTEVVDEIIGNLYFLKLSRK